MMALMKNSFDGLRETTALSGQIHELNTILMNPYALTEFVFGDMTIMVGFACRTVSF